MRVLRMENPEDQRGPMWTTIPVPKAVMEEVVKEVKGTDPVTGKSLDGSPNSRVHNIHDELDVAIEKGDWRTLDRFERVRKGSKSSYPNNTPLDLIFGMTNEGDFNLWFPPRAKELLAQYGFKKAVYEVPDDEVAPVYSQAVWKRKDASLVAYEDLVPLEA